MSLFHHADDLGQHSPLADLGGDIPEAPCGVHCAAVHRRTGGLFYWKALPGEHGLVHHRNPVDHLPVHWQFLSWTDSHRVACHHLGYRYLGSLSVADYPGRRRPVPQQFTDRIRRLPLGASLQKPAQQDQGDDHRRRVEIDRRIVIERGVGVEKVRFTEEAAEEGQGRAVHIGNAGADRHQRVHVGRPVLDCSPSRPVKDRARPKLYRSSYRPQKHVELEGAQP